MLDPVRALLRFGLGFTGTRMKHLTVLLVGSFLTSVPAIGAPLGAPAALGSDSQYPVLPKEGYLVGWPTSGYGSGPFTRGVIARTLPAAQADFYGLRGDTLVRMPQAGFFDGFLVAQTGVADIALLVDAASAADAVVATGTGGIQVHAVDAATGLDSVTVIDASYTTGTAVHTADVDGDGSSEIVVLDADAQTFTVYTQAGSAWSVLGSIAFAGLEILDFDLARFDAVPGHDLVLARVDGVEVYRLSWPGPQATQLLWRHAPGYQQSQVETLPGSGLEVPGSSGPDAFVWAVRAASMQKWAFSRVDSFSFGNPLFLEPGTEVVGMSVGRLDADEEHDLVLSLTDASRLLTVLHSSSPGPAFVTDNVHEVATLFAGENADAFPAVGDLDGNARGDVLLGNELLGDLQVLYDLDDQPYDQHGTFEAFDWAGLSSNLPEGWYFELDSQAQPKKVTLRTRVSALADLVSAGVSTGVWRQASNTEPFGESAVGHCPAAEVAETGEGIYELAMAYDASAAPFEPETCLALLATTEDPLGNGSRPAIWLGIGIRLEAIGGDPPPSPLTENPFAVWRLGYDLTQVSYHYVTGSGVGIVVEVLPLRRIKPPPGTVPVAPSTNCLAASQPGE